MLNRAKPLASLLLFLANIALGAEMVVLGDESVYLGDGVHARGTSIGIIGEIEAGDFELFRKILAETGGFVFVTIHSPGGDLVEAIRIGKTIRESLLPVSAASSFELEMYRMYEQALHQPPLEQDTFSWWPSSIDGDVFGTCYSACAVIWASGVIRQGGIRDHSDNAQETTMGLHRPQFDDKYFSTLSVDEAQLQYARLLSALTKYMADMGVSNTLIEKMLTIPSNDLYLLMTDELKSISGWSPAIDEWVSSKCSDHDVGPQERADWDELSSESNLSGPESRYRDSLSARIGLYGECRRNEFVQAQLERRAN